jgi:formylglycine-generating enzyme required for sulfatase activity/cytochrome oxidase Cu insertion factor (SCO1/SenC/PrrC family)
MKPTASALVSAVLRPVLAAALSLGLAAGADPASAPPVKAPAVEAPAIEVPPTEVPPRLASIEGGEYQPLYAKAADKRKVGSFLLGLTQVTNGEFLEFVREHPEWRKSKVSRAEADENYLRHWAGDLDLGPQAGLLRDAPVTHVSWFAARAYAAARGLRLPTQDEWEFAARADATRTDASTDPAFLRRVLEWYARPTPAVLPPAREADANVYGLRGMHGVIWEWVDDFNSAMIVGDSRGDGSLERRLFCGAGSLLTADVSNYAAYMRYAMRSSLRGDYCVASLGFRVARSLAPEAEEEAAAVLAAPGRSAWDVGGGWRSQKDAELQLPSLRGKVRVVTMGFTSCAYACPRIVGDLQRIEAALGKQADSVGFVFATIDPKRDTPAKMDAFATERRLDPSRWLLLRGEPEKIQELSVRLGFKYQPVDEDFAHSNVIAVLDEDGRIIHREEALGAEIEPSVAAIRKLLSSKTTATP